MKKIYFYCLFIFLSFAAYSQDLVDSSNETFGNDYKYDSKLLLHYSIDELNDIRLNYSDEFIKIEYYHLSSYQIIITDELNPYQSQFNLEIFDISKYENQRKLDVPVELNFDKYGLKLIITPYLELQYLLPHQEFMINYLQNQ